MLFADYEHRALRELSRFETLAQSLLQQFDLSTPADVLLVQANTLRADYESMQQLLLKEIASELLTRHLRFLVRHLEQGQPDYCRGDIEDICARDVPALRLSLQSAHSSSRYDPELVTKVGSLVREQELDSAIRKGFVLLEGRLVAQYQQPTTLDGTDLVDAIFGKHGVMAGSIPADKLAAYRNLLDGLYGTFRNHYGHRDDNPGWHEAAAVLGMINWILVDLLPQSPLPGPTTPVSQGMVR